MKKADLSKNILQAMGSNCSGGIPISVKCRIGVDDWDDFEFAASFIETLEPVCQRFYLHARKCVLNGLMNARANRTVPPLNFPRVYELCRRFPRCEFWINGGIRTLEEAKEIVSGNEREESPTEACDCYTKDGHAVPCTLCNLPYGSCCEPPTTAPPNLRGIMMGRAAFDNPAAFWNVDRFFYGESFNPCQTRRQVLDQYCQFLERTYPRRCCDDDERVTYRYPAPKVHSNKEYCIICQDIYGPETCAINTQSKPPPPKEPPKTKVASRIIGPCLKPIVGIFSGVPYSRAFRRACDDLGQDPYIRNCGPGYILRKAMQTIPDKILDRPFEEG